MLPVFRQKETLLHGLHPAAALSLVSALALSALLLENPLYVAAVCAGTLGLIGAAETWRECGAFLRIGLFVAMLIAILNPIVNNQGTHVLVYGPRIPLWGHLDITLEAVLYGLSSALRVFTVIAVCGLASTVVDPDGLLGIFSRISSRSSLAAALAVRLYPSMVCEAREIREAQLARGERLEEGGWLRRSRAHLPMMLSLFQGSLDRAASIAESMSARGFGSGRRTRWRSRFWRIRDSVAVAAALAAIGVTAAAMVSGKGAYSFFPTAPNPWSALSPAAWTALSLTLSFVVVLTWSWKRWHWLRSRV